MVKSYYYSLQKIIQKLKRSPGYKELPEIR